MKPGEARGSWSDLPAVEARRIWRDPKILIAFAVILGVPLIEPEVGVALLGGATLFLPVIVGWSWGADLERGSFVPLSLARRGRAPFLIARMALLFLLAAVAALPVLLGSFAGPADRILLAGSIFELLMLGFLLVTALRSSHAGWIPMFAALFGVLAPTLAVIRVNPTAQPPLAVGLLALAVIPTGATVSSAIPKERILWLVPLIGAAFGALAVAILVRRASALERRG